MNSQRYRIVAMGDKSPNMLSEITSDLFDFGCEIETISSLRLGHSFVVVLMVETFINENGIEKCLKSVVKKYKLRLDIDLCTRKKFPFIKSDAFIRIRGIHTPGIKAFVIKQLTEAGLDIHALESDVYEKEGKDIFVSNIKGQARDKFERIASIREPLKEKGIDITIAKDWQLLL